MAENQCLDDIVFKGKGAVLSALTLTLIKYFLMAFISYYLHCNAKSMIESIVSFKYIAMPISMKSSTDNNEP
ncbi:MAG: hypothetical protein N3F66_05810 [Spirochaetes bacterium]|nr:hypothetical protein [Spirochaetota bacterium]